MYRNSSNGEATVAQAMSVDRLYEAGFSINVMFDPKPRKSAQQIIQLLFVDAGFCILCLRVHE